MQKKKNYKPFIIISLLVSILVLSRDMENTSIDFMTKIRLPFTLGFQKQVFEMEVGESLKLRVNRINVRVKYRTSSFKTAIVTPFGRVYALREGTVIIYGDIGDKTISCKINIIKGKE